MTFKLKALTALFAVAVATCGTFSQQAVAVPVTGGVSFQGNYTPQNSSGTTTSDFNNTTQIVFPAGQQAASSGTGSFSFVTFGTPVTMANTTTANAFKFDIPPFPTITNFYTVGGISFDLTSVTHSVRTESNGTQTLTLAGFGTFHGTGYDNTRGNYTFSANTAAGTFSFSASSAALPDGGMTVGLLGLALVGVEGLRRMLGAKALA